MARSSYRVSAWATVHCLTGCFIGEFLGLTIGVLLGFSVLGRVALAVVLAYVCGLGLAMTSLMRSEGLSMGAAWRAIWLGEVISIGVMEIAMNTADYHAGGLGVETLADPLFWWGLAVAAVAGFLAAWPVNHWLIGRELKRCH